MICEAIYEATFMFIKQVGVVIFDVTNLYKGFQEIHKSFGYHILGGL